ncbi:Uncharacterized membrane protein YhaH, DUF805 family [Amphritea atlantica]|uniref:Uncharacterized membrane protein YhaH, DUF805 family n=1 Tax=Amphritea atlantica TaxID=355243 RepID=A0A1H9LZ86_9GAMM|nr:DUF805 domain-containing protein [Amphritea atlantica]SER16712.1 Uncharacterized membrane protein YhaH, DUF805 family [Amphritea atlantica]
MNTDIYASPQAALDHPSDSITPLTLKQILFSFEGRIGRKTFWLASLASALVTWAITAGLVAMLVAAINTSSDPASGIITYIALTFLLCIPTGWIGLALQAKRWHDRNKSAWWILIMFVPLIGPFWVLIEAGFLPGSPEANDYGAPSA